jgi:mannose-6-phosphate isomerase-like protein (cupin superfamily)
MSVRRVVTANNAEGKGVVVRDDEVEPVAVHFLNTIFYNLWAGDRPPSLSDELTPQPHARPNPPGGFRFLIGSHPPGPMAPPAEADAAEVTAEVEAKMPGMIDFFEKSLSGMHTATSVDFGVVLSGEIVMVLDDGVTVHLRQGDTYVQYGTHHSWRNVGDEPANLVVLGIGSTGPLH